MRLKYEVFPAHKCYRELGILNGSQSSRAQKAKIKALFPLNIQMEH